MMILLEDKSSLECSLTMQSSLQDDRKDDY